ncbi:hypothetical protein L6164_029340 [Bauhinia variegata]|uniref:Uncharacterized protein n=1 Tax=Bauhinia variegata TaxID=167791 RepID=A0ACB9L8X4_BAUVA|nr:hypothetical protein L6164_029340 [Bauhinia variegata]
MAMAKTATPTSTITERVSTQKVEQAVNSLLKWRDSKSQQEKPKLFEQDDEFLYLILTLKKIPQKGRVNPYKIELRHSLLSEFSEICLIIDDRSKSNLTKDDAQKKIKSENIPVSKVLKLSKLRSNYRSFEAKRKLLDSYHMFFTDKRAVPLLPKLLGKHFFKKKKTPVPLNLTHKNWKEQIERTCSSALLYLTTGSCCVVKVAKVGMEKDEIVENVIAAINGAVENVPKKWGNVRSLHLRLSESLALPIYQAVPDVKLKIDGVKDKELEEKAEEAEESGKKGDKKDQKVGKKKGRIHEVRYMDDAGEEFSEDESGGQDDGDIAEDDSENDEMGSGKLVDKKRKKASKKKVGALTELNSVKRLKKSAKDKSTESTKQQKDGLSAKAMKENVRKQKMKESPVEDGEKKNKKKSGLTKLEGGDMKVKAKKSNKAA